MADDEEVRIEKKNHLLHVINTIIRDLEAGNLQNDCLDSLEFCIDWLYSIVNRCQNVDIIDGRVVSCIREVRDTVVSRVLCCTAQIRYAKQDRFSPVREGDQGLKYHVHSYNS